jgi:hypothetical protein
MKSAKLKHFLTLINRAMDIIETRKRFVVTPEYREYQLCCYIRGKDNKLLNPAEVTDEMLDLTAAMEVLNYFSKSLISIRTRMKSNEFDNRLTYPKGRRPGFGFSRHVDECGGIIAEPLFNDELYMAFANMEHYHNHELE